MPFARTRRADTQQRSLQTIDEPEAPVMPAWSFEVPSAIEHGPQLGLQHGRCPSSISFAFGCVFKTTTSTMMRSSRSFFEGQPGSAIQQHVAIQRRSRVLCRARPATAFSVPGAFVLCALNACILAKLDLRDIRPAAVAPPGERRPAEHRRCERTGGGEVQTPRQARVEIGVQG